MSVCKDVNNDSSVVSFIANV